MAEDADCRKVTCETLRVRLLHEPSGELDAAALAHLSLCDDCAGALVTAVLKQGAEPEIPTDFAARVCAALPPPETLPKDAVEASHRFTGTRIAVAISMILALAACVSFAAVPQTLLPAGLLGTALAAFLITEGVGLALWLGLRGNWR
ncbi:MAG: hypothetical protein P4M01_10245 [Acidobacteriota bacterium]|nr:hypothetical protein [Acidobacteriota bacterium]